jgi:hypothetical protein
MSTHESDHVPTLSLPRTVSDELRSVSMTNGMYLAMRTYRAPARCNSDWRATPNERIELSPVVSTSAHQSKKQSIPRNRAHSVTASIAAGFCLSPSTKA